MEQEYTLTAVSTNFSGHHGRAKVVLTRKNGMIDLEFKDKDFARTVDRSFKTSLKTAVAKSLAESIASGSVMYNTVFVGAPRNVMLTIRPEGAMVLECPNNGTDTRKGTILVFLAKDDQPTVAAFLEGGGLAPPQLEAPAFGL